MCLFYDPTLVTLEGHVAFGLSVCVSVCVRVCACACACVYVCPLGCMPVGLCAEMWLAGSVGHFFETLHGEC